MTDLRPASRLSLARRPGGWVVTDAALALLMLAALVTEVATNADMTPQLPLLVLTLPLTLPLAWRGRQPVACLALVAGANLAMAVVSTGPFSPQQAILPLLVALYTAASRTGGPTSVVAGTGSLALVVAAYVVAPGGDADDFWPWLIWSATWAGGTFVRWREEAAAAHAARAALLEVEARTAAADSAERERDRIARELHDVVAHSVSVMVVQAGAERLRLGEDAGRTGEVLAGIEDAGRAALAELRAMLGVLRDGGGEDLTPLPGLGEVADLVERVRAAGVEVGLEWEPADLADRAGDVPAAAGLAAYRIVQEALTNVVRHAPGASARVCLAGRDGCLEVRVDSTRGSGRAAAGSGGRSGRGLVGMRERAGALGGDLVAGPAPGGGFSVVATLPGAGVAR